MPCCELGLLACCAIGLRKSHMGSWRPAGAAGRGLYRLHQFSKVELFVVSTPEQSEALLGELVAFEEALFTDLGLHFKVLVRAQAQCLACTYRHARQPEQQDKLLGICGRPWAYYAAIPDLH